MAQSGLEWWLCSCMLRRQRGREGRRLAHSLSALVFFRQRPDRGNGCSMFPLLTPQAGDPSEPSYQNRPPLAPPFHPHCLLAAAVHHGTVNCRPPHPPWPWPHAVERNSNLHPSADHIGVPARTTQPSTLAVSLLQRRGTLQGPMAAQTAHPEPTAAAADASSVEATHIIGEMLSVDVSHRETRVNALHACFTSVQR